MKQFVRRGVERLLKRYEYRLADSAADPPGLAGACARLSAAGFKPGTVIDVGVGPGTPWLYGSFPAAHFELFEPLDLFRPLIEKSTNQIDAAVHYCALGDHRGTLAIEVNVEHPTSSTMASYAGEYVKAAYRGTSLPAMAKQEVQVRTLDEFGPFAGPTLLKLDVEGYEAKVLKGATQTLQDVDVIISAVSVAPRHRGRPCAWGLPEPARVIGVLGYQHCRDQPDESWRPNRIHGPCLRPNRQSHAIQLRRLALVGSARGRCARREIVGSANPLFGD